MNESYWESIKERMNMKRVKCENVEKEKLTPFMIETIKYKIVQLKGEVDRYEVGRLDDEPFEANFLKKVNNKELKVNNYGCPLPIFDYCIIKIYVPKNKNAIHIVMNDKYNDWKEKILGDNFLLEINFE